MRIRFTFIFLVSLFVAKADFVQDSVQSILNCKGSDSLILAKLTTLGRGLKTTPSKAIEVLAELRKYSEKPMSKKDLASCYRKIGVIYGDLNNYDKALEFSLKAARICDETNDDLGLASCYNNIANYYQNKGGITGDTIFYNRSLDYHLKNIQLRKDLNDTSWLYMAYSNASIAYIRLKKYEEAINILNISFNYYTNYHDTKASLGAMRMVMSNLGDAYLGKAHITGKPEYFRKSLSYFVDLVNAYKQENNILNDDYADALEKTGEIYQETEQYERSLEHLSAAFNIYKQVQNYAGLSTSSLRLANLLQEKGDFKKSNEYYSLHVAYKDTVLNQQNKSNIEQMQMLYQSNIKDKEIEKLKTDTEIQSANLNRQRTITFASFAGLGLLVLIGIVLLKSYYNKRKANLKLTLAYNNIESKNRLITESINYAKRLQSTFLPPEESLKKHLQNFFLFYEPKDIVSGDFYWFAKHNGNLFFVVADCTGHGVPGALMSTIGNTMLNEIILQKNVSDPGEILNLLDKGIIKVLRQENKDLLSQEDGMDLSLCCINEANKSILKYATANHSLFIKTKNSLTELKGDIFSIGGSMGDIPKIFNTYEHKCHEESFVILSSDGYFDQFGGKNHSKFLITRFEELLLKIDFNSNDSGKLLANEFDAWKGLHKQTDDVLVAGFKL